MPVKVPERLFALYGFMLSHERPVPRQRIRDSIDAYRSIGSDSAFERTFERDKAALRHLGMKIAAIQDYGETLYRIERENLWLGREQFTPAERLTLGIAARLWSDPNYANDAERAVRRLGYGEQDADGAVALTHVTPRLSGGGGHLETILGALAHGSEVSFSYRSAHSLDTSRRRFRPWGVGQRFDHWYVSGWDADRQALRNFRLSRMTSMSVRESSLPGAPEDFSMQSVLEGISESPAPVVVLRCTVGAAPVVLDWSESGTGLRLQEAFPETDSVTRIVEAAVDVPDVLEFVRCLAELGSGVEFSVPEGQELDEDSVRREVDRTIQRAIDLQGRVSAAVTDRDTEIIEPKRGRNRESNDRRFVRLVDLASYVGSNPGCAIRDISRHLHVSAAQVRQDIDALANASDEILGGAYLRVTAYDDEVFVELPEELGRALNLAPDQTIRLLLAIQLLGQVSPDHARTVEEISRKLVSGANGAGVSSDQLSIRLEPQIAKTVDALRAAADGGRMVEIDYRSRGQTAPSERRVRPHDVYSRGNTWYLEAESPAHAEIRTYRIEAIRGLRVVEAAEDDVVPAQRESRPEPARTLVWVAADAEPLAEALGGEILGHADVPGSADDVETPQSGLVIEIDVIDWFSLYRLMLHHAGSMALWRARPWTTQWYESAKARGIDVAGSW